MKRLTTVLAMLAMVAAASYATYVWGWYRGLEYHAVVSGMSEANVALSAAKSLRQSDPALALELIETNLTWVSATLNDESLHVPDDQRGNYELVLRQLRDYQARYAETGAPSDELTSPPS